MIFPEAIILLEPGMNSGALAQIDLDALRHNLQQVRTRAPGARVMAVIKADAYGHGALHCARALAAADAFAVARFSEARELRESGIDKRILLLPGVFSADELGRAAQLHLDIALHQYQQLEVLEQARGLQLDVWLKINTGMHRLGFTPADTQAIRRRLAHCPVLREPPRLMTHLSDADIPASTKTTTQIQSLLDQAGNGVEISIANSAAVLAWPESHQDWVRPGIMLYGTSPFSGDCGADHGLRPVMRLSTRLMDIKLLPRGEAIGYGSTWTAPQDMPVGAAAVGYADGYPRHLPAGTPALINGHRACLIGRVSMDTITLDLRACPQAVIGDEVLLWGSELPVETIARKAGSIGYELLSRVGHRVPRDHR